MLILIGPGAGDLHLRRAEVAGGNEPLQARELPGGG